MEIFCQWYNDIQQQLKKDKKIPINLHKTFHISTQMFKIFIFATQAYCKHMSVVTSVQNKIT